MSRCVTTLSPSWLASVSFPFLPLCSLLCYQRSPCRLPPHPNHHRPSVSQVLPIPLSPPRPTLHILISSTTSTHLQHNRPNRPPVRSLSQPPTLPTPTVFDSPITHCHQRLVKIFWNFFSSLRLVQNYFSWVLGSFSLQLSKPCPPVLSSNGLGGMLPQYQYYTMTSLSIETLSYFSTSTLC